MFALTAMAQSPEPPRFDVATVKALPDRSGRGEFRVTPTGVSFPAYPLGFVIRWAYGLHPYQAYETNGPAWLEPGLGCVRFDIIGKTDRPVAVDQLRLMMRTLLAERLQLSVHRESKPMTVAAITVGKDGPKLKASDKEEMTFRQDGGYADPDSVWHFEGAEISRLSEWLYGFVPYLIVDDTGLQGRYDLDLHIFQYKDLANQPAANGQIDLAPAVSKALEAVGLKMDLKKRPVDVLVIDHVASVIQN